MKNNRVKRKLSSQFENDVIEGSVINVRRSLGVTGPVGLMNSLNPLQLIAGSITQIAHYKHQVRLVETEQKRITAEANLQHHQIDVALSLGLRALDYRRVSLQNALDAVSFELGAQHIERSAVLECINNLVENISKPELSVLDKQLSHETLSLLTTVLKAMGERSTGTLSQIINTTQKSLETLPCHDLLRLAANKDCL
jgi:hypothetical protein